MDDSVLSDYPLLYFVPQGGKQRMFLMKQAERWIVLAATPVLHDVCLHPGSRQTQDYAREASSRQKSCSYGFVDRGAASGCCNRHGYCEVGYHVNLFAGSDEQTAD